MPTETAESKRAEARAAGADFVGGDDMIEKVKGGWTDFDAAVATPDLMGKVGTLGCSSSAEWQLALAAQNHPAHAAVQASLERRLLDWFVRTSDVVPLREHPRSLPPSHNPVPHPLGDANAALGAATRCGGRD